LSLRLILAVLAAAVVLQGQTTETIYLRGHQQVLRIYGTRGAQPVIVSSGDGGWVHLGPHVAEVLAAHGFFVVGFDVKAYLESFTSSTSVLRPEEEPADFRTLAAYAARGSSQKPILIGVSEGAGLSVLAATDPETKKQIGGVIGLGLPDMNELAWRWRDSLIYVTHGLPNEPMFSAAGVIGKVAPVPIAAIHSTNDEFIPVSQVERTLLNAQEPKNLWVVKAANHRFSDNLAEFDQRLLEAMEWLKSHQPK
jgi:dienelactone hydrolase